MRTHQKTNVPTPRLPRPRNASSVAGRSGGEQNLAHIFLNVDMRANHRGLIAFLKKEKIKIEKGDYIVFLNQKRTLLKMFCNSDKVHFVLPPRTANRSRRHKVPA